MLSYEAVALMGLALGQGVLFAWAANLASHSKSLRRSLDWTDRELERLDREFHKFQEKVEEKKA